MGSLYVLWFGALALLLVSLAVLLPTLLKDEAAAPVRNSEDALRSLYRAQLQELVREREAGNLSDSDFAQAEEELQRRLLAELDQRAQPRLGTHKPWLPRVSALVLAVAVPVCAFVLYVQVGDPQAAARLAQVDELGHGAGQVNVDAMVQGLAQRLQHEPDDLPGWVMLARSYEIMERYEDAVQAYQQALQASVVQAVAPQEQARLWADMADAISSANNGSLAAAMEAIDQALKLDPQQPKALALAGTAAVQIEEYAQAREHWQALLALLEPGSDVALRVQDDLMQLDLLLNSK